MIFVVLGVMLAIGVAGATIYAAYVDHVDTELDRAYERAHERQARVGTPRQAYGRRTAVRRPPTHAAAAQEADTAVLADRRALARHAAPDPEPVQPSAMHPTVGQPSAMHPTAGLPTTGIDDREYRHADDGDDAVVAESRHRFDGRHARTA